MGSLFKVYWITILVTHVIIRKCNAVFVKMKKMLRGWKVLQTFLSRWPWTGRQNIRRSCYFGSGIPWQHRLYFTRPQICFKIDFFLLRGINITLHDCRFFSYTEIFKISSNGSDRTNWDKANGCDSVVKLILDDLPMIKLRNSHGGHWSTKIWYSGTPLIRSPMGRKQSGRNSVFFFTRKCMAVFFQAAKKVAVWGGRKAGFHCIDVSDYMNRALHSA